MSRVARSPTRHFLIGLARAGGGAVIFGLPLLMTMEMWQLGFTMDRYRLVLLLLVNIPLLVGLSHYSGFEETFDFHEDVVDAFVAYAVGFVVAAAILALLDVITPGMPAIEVTGKIALQAVPASMGALLAQSQFGGTRDEDEGAREHKRPSTYASQLFLMAAGALFLAFNIAPTEEMVLIAQRLGVWHILGLIVLSIAAMHAFVYAAEFAGQEDIHPDDPEWSVFLRYTVVGFAIAIGISTYVLWTFGRLDDTHLIPRTVTVLVLSFPAAIGAAAARLLL